MSEAIIQAKLISHDTVNNIVHFDLLLDNYVICDIVWSGDEDMFLFQDAKSFSKKIILASIANVRTKYLLKDLVWKLLSKKEPVLYVGPSWSKKVVEDFRGITVSVEAGQFHIDILFQNFSTTDLLDLKYNMKGDLLSLRETYGVLINNIADEVDYAIAKLSGKDNEVEAQAVSIKGNTMQELESAFNEILQEGYNIKSQSICFDGDKYCAIVIVLPQKTSNSVKEMNVF